MAGGESGTAYYNEIDAYAAAWLRNLISRNLIAPGEVDERSIEDVPPDDLRGFTQCHFFAGIGVWSYALRRAGWPDERPVWTGSCPCQPFSAAGKRGGTADERHLWPAFHHLIEAVGPAVVLGEQVASKDGLAWLDTVCTDLEVSGYAVGATDLCAAGVGAPHIRQRLWFVGVADAEHNGQWEHWQRLGSAPRQGKGSARQRERLRADTADGSAAVGLADTDGGNTGAERQQRSGEQRQQPQDGGVGGLADDNGPRGAARIPGQEHRQEGHAGEPDDRSAQQLGRPGEAPDAAAGPTNGLWRNADWLLCRDGKWRPVESGTFPLAHGAPARVGRLRAYGNAIVAEAAREFIEAVDWAIGGDLA